MRISSSTQKPRSSASSLGDKIRDSVARKVPDARALGEKIRGKVSQRLGSLNSNRPTNGTHQKSLPFGQSDKFSPRDSVSLQESRREGAGAEREPEWMKNIAANYGPNQSQNTPPRTSGGAAPDLGGDFPSPPSGPHGATGNLQDTRGWIPLDAPTTSQPGQRSADQYNSVLDQFDVENNPRYTPRDQGSGSVDTFCNIYVSDATRAMGAEVPHFWKGEELDANRTADWLRDEGKGFGWRPVTEQEAQELANQGNPVVAAWDNPNGIGHVAMVRPGELSGQGPAISQAGSQNLNNAHLRDTFGDADVILYAHQ